MPRFVKPRIEPIAGVLMPIWGAVSSSNESHGAAVVRQVGSAPLSYSGKASDPSSSTDLPRAVRTILGRMNKAFRKLADKMLGLDHAELSAAIENGTIVELVGHG